MEILVQIDQPRGCLISNLSQVITGWLAIPGQEHDAEPQFAVDGQPVAAYLRTRQDVQQAMPGYRIHGWTVYVDPATTFRRPSRTLAFTLRYGERWEHTRRFYKSRHLMPAENNSPLFFMHIPKTAGTALRQFTDCVFSDFPSLAIYEHYPGVAVQDALDSHRDFAQTRELLFGHFDFSFPRTLNAVNPKVITVFRDPVALVRSYFAFGADPAPQFLDNPLVRHVCGVSYTVPAGEISDTHLQCALRFVEQHMFVLQQEALQEFADDVCRTFALPRFEIPRINQSPPATTPPVDVSLVDLRYDLELYRACRAKSQDFLGFLDTHAGRPSARAAAP